MLLANSFLDVCERGEFFWHLGKISLISIKTRQAVQEALFLISEMPWYSTV